MALRLARAASRPARPGPRLAGGWCRLVGARARRSKRCGTDLVFYDLQIGHLAEEYLCAALGNGSGSAGKVRLEGGDVALAQSERITRVARSRRSGGLLITLALTLILPSVACSGDDAGTLPATTSSVRSSTSPSTTSTPTTEASAASSSTPSGRTREDEIIARYVGYWDARFDANSGTPDPNDPALRQYATGAQLDAVLAETQTNLDQGLAFRRAANPADIQRITVVEVNGDRAVVQECVVSDGVIVQRDSGEIVNDEVTTHNVRGEMQRVEGVWRVSSAQLVQRWEGVAGCARAS